MTYLQALEAAIADVESADLLTARDKAVVALRAMVALASELVADAEMARLAAEHERELLVRRVEVLERRAQIEAHSPN
ncbi:hypothetical protein [Silvimonas soli]|uniref:hypothetical protein n=1 Tax=Silvimonas soli TaxID=2980100 RepID=UPI0024B3AF03|nr:hypothetical protein [Silvimonas soli]